MSSQRPTYGKRMRPTHGSCSHPSSGRERHSAHSCAFSKDCLHAENSVKPNSTATAEASQQTGPRFAATGRRHGEAGQPRERNNRKGKETTVWESCSQSLFLKICLFFSSFASFGLLPFPNCPVSSGYWGRSVSGTKALPLLSGREVTRLPQGPCLLWTGWPFPRSWSSWEAPRPVTFTGLLVTRGIAQNRAHRHRHSALGAAILPLASSLQELQLMAT